MSAPELVYYIKPGLVLGRVFRRMDGWVYMPFQAGRAVSRKTWPTPEAAVHNRAWGGRLVKAHNFRHAQAQADGRADESGTLPGQAGEWEVKR